MRNQASSSFVGCSPLFIRGLLHLNRTVFASNRTVFDENRTVLRINRTVFNGTLKFLTSPWKRATDRVDTSMDTTFDIGRDDLNSRPEISFNSAKSLRVGSMREKFSVCIFSLVLLSACGVGHTIPQSEQVSSLMSPNAININTADNAELQRIPHIGEKLAADIIEFRKAHGPFRRPEHLLLINGISDRRFREIRHLVRVN